MSNSYKCPISLSPPAGAPRRPFQRRQKEKKIAELDFLAITDDDDMCVAFFRQEPAEMSKNKFGKPFNSPPTGSDPGREYRSVTTPGGGVVPGSTG